MSYCHQCSYFDCECLNKGKGPWGQFTKASEEVPMGHKRATMKQGERKSHVYVIEPGDEVVVAVKAKKVEHEDGHISCNHEYLRQEKFRLLAELDDARASIKQLKERNQKQQLHHDELCEKGVRLTNQLEAKKRECQNLIDQALMRMPLSYATWPTSVRDYEDIKNGDELRLRELREENAKLSVECQELKVIIVHKGKLADEVRRQLGGGRWWSKR